MKRDQLTLGQQNQLLDESPSEFFELRCEFFHPTAGRLTENLANWTVNLLNGKTRRFTQLGRVYLERVRGNAGKYTCVIGNRFGPSVSVTFQVTISRKF